ncbi:peptidylprolyl isomerase [Alteraurantiacibacter aestuarii]|uniref:Peptidylprolyl isomerase n=1 Tax=Alteraurantiacibacter aestuarii TaxID=650004 RepID=A0A844ZPN5_9SPHN|nr:peptidylprolyl isomerase [Alteraurantiacibacter aestuarii]MXO87599.1 peptidylprolyl isomerase [Alteraurantiacibacter aestuarii]
MSRLALLSAVSLAFATPLAAQENAAPITPANPVTPDSIVAASTPEEWTEIDPGDLLVMVLAPGDDESPRFVVIQLIPAPFSQPWVENIRTLARAHWWDGTSVYRVVDNWVAQWGDVSEDRPLPEGVVSPESEYASVLPPAPEFDQAVFPLTAMLRSMWIEEFVTGEIVEAPNADAIKQAIARQKGDSYALETAFVGGWPMGSGPDTQRSTTAWPVHCYASVGVARDLAPDTGTGSELYAVIGHAPRQLDRNIAVVGRVIDGIEHLSTLRRGTGDAGVYESRDQDTPILSVRLASETEEAEHWRYQYLSTQSESFARYVAVRANRNDAFYTVPASGVDICNVPVPIRHIDPLTE